jgi:large subunit ribosomal protein L24
MAKTRLKAGESVVVISGSHAGKQGKLLQVLPRKSRAIVEGINMVKKHQKKSQDNPQGSIVEREGSIHVSNLMASTVFEARQAKKEKS